MTLMLTLSDIVGLLVAAFAIAVIASLALGRWLRERRCHHDQGVNETRACDAICRACGKNLGFIGTWRGQRERKP